MDGVGVITRHLKAGRKARWHQAPCAAHGGARGWLPAIVAALLTTWMGCSSPPAADRADFDSPHPASRIFAAERAVNKGDPSAIPHLIEGLRSDDPAVRFTSIHALERLTTRTFDYRYYDTPQRRQEAIKQWEDAYRSGELAQDTDTGTTVSAVPE
ncbi:MAG: HEAT repeat domain-containing protein [Planctomycetes bacterium]|nr:HEAT repeat domain-containing protein [Planctomycetota bacterium]